jgi:hypothetical protein
MGYMGFGYGAVFAIDTFFWMSGFWAAYKVLEFMYTHNSYTLSDYI